MDDNNAAELTLDEDDMVLGTELSMLLGKVYAGVVPNVPGLPPPDPRALLKSACLLGEPKDGETGT